MDELVVLAAALGVPPISLVIPVGHAATFEILPGRVWTIDAARRWFDGTERLLGADHPEDAPEGLATTDLAPLDALRLAREHDKQAGRVRELTRQVKDAASRRRLLRGAPSEDLALRVDQAQEVAEGAAAAVRAAGSPLTAEVIELNDAWHAANDHLQVLRQQQESEREQIVAVKGLCVVRQSMRDRGQVPPPLPADLTWLDEDDAAVNSDA